MKGWGPKSSTCPSKPRETKLFGGISRNFCRDIPEAPEKVKKKKFVLNSRPLFASFEVNSNDLLGKS